MLISVNFDPIQEVGPKVGGGHSFPRLWCTYIREILLLNSLVLGSLQLTHFKSDYLSILSCFGEMMVGGTPALVPPTSINSPRRLLELAKLLFYLTLLPEKASLVITLYTQVCTYNIPPLPNCIVLVRLLINLLTVHRALEYNANMLHFPATQRLDQKVFNSTCCSYLG